MHPPENTPGNPVTFAVPSWVVGPTENRNGAVATVVEKGTPLSPHSLSDCKSLTAVVVDTGCVVVEVPIEDRTGKCTTESHGVVDHLLNDAVAVPVVASKCDA